MNNCLLLIKKVKVKGIEVYHETTDETLGRKRYDGAY